MVPSRYIVLLDALPGCELLLVPSGMVVYAWYFIGVKGINLATIMHAVMLIVHERRV